MSRIRVQMQKHGRCAFLSHLDTVRALERAIRRSGLRLAYSEGFHPHPKISFAAPLAVGVTSDAEVADIEFLDDVSPQEVVQELTEQLPFGLGISKAVAIEREAQSLMSRIVAACYVIDIDPGQIGPLGLEQGVEQILKRDSLVVRKEHKEITREIDVRPLILGLECVNGQSPRVRACLATGSTANLRPDDFVTALRELGVLSNRPGGLQVHRQQLLVERDGQLTPPI